MMSKSMNNTINFNRALAILFVIFFSFGKTTTKAPSLCQGTTNISTSYDCDFHAYGFGK